MTTKRPDDALAAWRSGEEWDLVTRMRDGDEAAFDRFAEDYLPAVYRFAAARLGRDRELLRDIVQTTACRAIERLPSFRGDGPLFAWLCACCRNVIASHFRTRGRRPREVELGDDTERDALLDLGPGPEGTVLRHESRQLVHDALEHLPERYARALEWKYLQGLPVREIADRLEVGPKAAESLLTRARAAFRDVYRHLAERRLPTPPTGLRPEGTR